MSETTLKKENLNEFNQAVKPVSLWADAWKRLKKNRMALIGLWVVGIFIFLSIIAPALVSLKLLYPFDEQVSAHVNLPPSFSPAGKLVMAKVEARIKLLEETLAEHGEAADSFSYDSSTGFDFGTADVPMEDESVEMESSDAAAETGAEAAVEEGAVTEEGAVAEGDATTDGYGDYMSGLGDPVKNELEQKQAELETLKATVDSDPIHKRRYLLGTDDLGRDMVSRIIFGGRISIMIGIIGALTAAFIGVVVGATAGYLGGWVDNIIMRIVDIMYGLPYMLIVIIIMAIVGEVARGSFVMLFVAIALVSWLTMARVVRGQVISLKNSEYVEAARSMGASTPRIIFRHLLPNTLGVIIVYSTLMMPSFIMSESFLSFLGLGVSAPNASWGTLVSFGIRGIEPFPWQLLGPGLTMTLFLFSMNFLGDGLRDALDPQSKNRT